MKKVIIIYLIFFPFSAETQDYLNSSCTWKESFNELIFGISTVENYNISLIGDTTINNTTYHQVLKSGTRKVTNVFLDSLLEHRSIVKLLNPIREENGVFYYLDTFSNTEKVLHDFNLEIGDTIISNCSSPQIIEEIDTVWIGSIGRKRFKIKGNGQQSLIEGIGSTQGLFQSTCRYLHFGSRLRCYGFEGQFLELDPLAECGVIVSTEIVNLSDFKIEVYPNPAMNYLNVKIPFSKKGKYKIEIYGVDGRRFFLKNIMFSSIVNGIDISAIPKGMYIISLRSNKFFSMNKLMVN